MRQVLDFWAKLGIARTAALMVSGGAILMVGGGSACALFAQELATCMVVVNIIANGIFVANSVRPAHTVEVTLLGGLYRPLSQHIVGQLVSLCASNLETE